ncbi:MAG: nucleotidyltransferase family protein [bacterium]|nr:nucleotidyltransferase family protein [bacterium]
MSERLPEARETVSEKSMTSTDVVDLYAGLEKIGIKIWIDGGWSVDALLGEKTRSHGDLDIAIQYKDLAKFREFLESQGYKEVERDEDKKWNFVLGDDKGHEIDVHAFTFNENGYVIEETEYPDGSLRGIGVIDGHTVRCIDAEHLVRFHTRHEPKDKDYKDVAALCEKFGIEYPEGYVHLK